MRKNLLITYIFVVVIALFGSSYLSLSKAYDYIQDQNTEMVLIKARVLKNLLERDSRDEDELQDFLNQESERYESTVTLFDIKGNIIAQNSENKADSDIYKDQTELARAMESGEGTAIRYSHLAKVNYYFAAVKYNSEDGTGVIQIGTPMGIDHDFRMQMISRLVISAILIFLVSYLIARIYSKRLVVPIEELTEAADKIYEGDFDSKIYSHTSGEIGALGKSFNRMSKRINTTINTINSKESELKAILSSMTSGIIAVDLKNNIILFNQSFIDIMEISMADIENKYLYTVIRNASVNAVVDEVKQKGKKIKQVGFLPSNTEKVIEITGAPLKRDDGQLLGTLLVIDDITEFKKLQTIRQEFVSNVTHELKTPLTSIRGFVDTLKQGAISDPEVATRFLDIIDIEAERLHTLIQDILVLSEIESKKEEEKMLVNIKDTLEEAVDMLKGNLKEGVELIYTVAEGVDDFDCSKHRLLEIFINLIDNAIKYTEQGRVEVNCKKTDDTLIITVKDQGIGIEEQHLPRLFERFYRVDKGRSRNQGGTGLGLSIVKHIVELYDGSVSVSSKIGVGTTFTIKLPYNIKNG